MKYIKFYTCIVSLLTLCISCSKYLEAKSDQSLVIISNLQDLQSLFDGGRIDEGNLGADVASADDYYISFATFQALPIEQLRNMYVWNASNLFPTGLNVNDWNVSYNTVYLANTVLNGIDKIARTYENAESWDNIKGQALFLRAHSFSKIASVWSLAYDDATASTDLGIPLRLTSDFNVPSVRSTNLETYNQIITDLKLAIPLLPKRPLHSRRSSKNATYALLARTYLAMRKYDLAKMYADSCLQINSELIDYNTLNATSAFPFARFNKEVIYDTPIGGAAKSLFVQSRARVDTALEHSYTINDLRKTIFFSQNIDGTKSFKGNYAGADFFGGLTTDEVYLIRAECFARSGNINAAMTDLNTLLINRYKKGAFTPFTITNRETALSIILNERRKELIMRCTRWTDIKRLNKEGYDISLKRVLNNSTYILPANDLRFALPIPEDIISLTGMQQNPRSSESSN